VRVNEVGVVFMSGYSHEVLAPDALVGHNGAAFIEKPFNAGELLRTVRGLLDARGESRAIEMATSTALARILATDDRPEILRLVDRTLGETYECEFADSVAEARERLVENQFDVALCDTQMPNESGLVLVDEIARDHPDMAIVHLEEALSLRG
jgi:DNA-binding NtrC family response regulator